MKLALSCVLLANYLSISKDKKGKFSFRDFLSKMENKEKCYQYLSLNNFLKLKIVLAKFVSDR